MIYDICILLLLLVTSTSTKGNPTPLTQQDIEDILDDILC